MNRVAEQVPAQALSAPCPAAGADAGGRGCTLDGITRPWRRGRVWQAGSIEGGPTVALSDLDERILAALQADGRTSFRAIAASVGTSPNTVAKRVAALQRMRAILGFSWTTGPRWYRGQSVVFARVALRSHEAPDVHEFLQAVHATAEIVTCEAVSINGFDYVLKACGQDVAQCWKAAQGLPHVRKVSAVVVLGEIGNAHPLQLSPV